MRDPERIERLLSLIQRVWEKYPDLRLGQLLIVTGAFSTEDNFYVEDNVVEEALLNAEKWEL